ncbi:MAG: phosphate signaling complex protein PhoU [Bdellovibrionales bacterium]
MMERQLDSQLRELKDTILSMGGYVEKALEEAIQGLVKREPEKLKHVHEWEAKINEAHIVVDELCLKLLARQAPLAQDLRMVLAVVKINTDLERMGDQAVNIALNGQHYLNDSPLTYINDLAGMAAEVREMVREALDAFVRKDGPLAQKVLEKDDVVDRYKDDMFKTLIDHMKKNPSSIEACIDVLLIARNLERLGDHATNIAEDVIFITTGKDVRHGHEKA